MLQRVDKADDYIQSVLNNLRLDDEIEMNMEYGQDWKNIIIETSKNYNLEIALDKNQKPICLFGVVPAENNIGILILLATKDIEKRENYITFARGAKEQIARWQKEYSILCNRVHKKNSLAINWLKWLEFKFDNPLGLDESTYLFFYKGNLEDEKNRTRTDYREIQRVKRASISLCAKVERYSKLCCNH